MTTAERTRQQLDPSGTLGSRRFSVIMAVGAFFYALVLTVLSGEGGNPWLGAAALLLAAVASGVVLLGTSPAFAQFEAWQHLAVHGLILAAVGCSIAGQWGDNLYIQDDWGPICLGLLVMAMSAYRPASELMAMGLVSAVFLGFLTLLQTPMLPSGIPAFAYVMVTVVPVAGLSAAAASYGSTIVNALIEASRPTKGSQGDSISGLLADIERSVQQDRVTILGREVVPFFRDVLETGRITDQDRAYSAALAEEIREIMVAEANRTWLDLLVDQVGQRWFTLMPVVDDETRSASLMTTPQRTALRALVVALYGEPAFQRGSLVIALAPRGADCEGTLRAELIVPDSHFRSLFSPYFAVLRMVFRETQVGFHEGRLTVTFSYERR